MEKYNHWSDIKDIFLRSEFSDIWMCFMIPSAGYLFSIKKNKKWIVRFLYISFILLIVSGFFAIFTEVRLSKYVSSGFKFSPGDRPQHFAGEFWGRFTYLPIGFMSTHLTFGGVLAILVPGSLFSVLYLLYHSIKNRILYILFLLIFGGVSLLVLFYNQSRSAWLGILYASVLLYVKFYKQIHKKLFSVRVGLTLLLFLFIGSSSVVFFVKKNWLLERAFKESLQDNTTENQRYFIYRGSLKILTKSYLSGIGPGNFQKEHWFESEKMIQKEEQLWYELYITPRSHAHFDFLHFGTVGGLLTGILFIYMWFLLIRNFLISKSYYHSILLYGILSLLVAGLFQCYLLDDEVALPFYTLVGLAFSNKTENSVRYNLRSIILTVLPILLAFSVIVYKNRKEPVDVYHRKIWVDSLPDKKSIRLSLEKQLETKVSLSTIQKGFTIEGCLTHRFTKPISIRRENYKIKLSIPEHYQNPPTGVRIRIMDRDSFDQDKHYKAHDSRPLRDFYFVLKKGTNVLEFDSSIFSNTETDRFPENIFFRDFQFYIEGYPNTPYIEFPIIELGKLCNAQLFSHENGL